MFVRFMMSKKCCKQAMQVRHCFFKQTKCEEIEIPVPWGVLAGKWWGPQDKRPILGLHGWQDNCGSFDPLIQRLPSHNGYLVLDFPGHGLSSKLPSGVFYHGIDSVIIIRRIVNYFKWPKVSLLGHSLGAIVNYTYTLLYPSTVDFLICMDGLKPLVFQQMKIERMSKQIDNFLKYDNRNNSKEQPPAYASESLGKMLNEGTRNSISPESAKYILKRNVSPSDKEPDTFYFHRDARLKVSELLGWSQQDLVESAHRITCPLFLSKSSLGGFYEKKQHALEVMDIIRSNNKHMEYHDVEGTHHVHLNNPERLAGLISNFIRKYDLEDRSVGGIKEEMKCGSRGGR